MICVKPLFDRRTTNYKVRCFNCVFFYFFLPPPTHKYRMSSVNQDLVYQSRRSDNATVIKRQAAANALQQYSLLALQAVKDCEVNRHKQYKLFKHFI